MTTILKLTCGSCFKETESQPIKKRFVSAFGNKSWGFGHLEQPDLDTCVPEGWIWSDPYTKCTYCPDCWGSIIKESKT